MDFSVLGPLRVLNGRTPVEIRGAKERTLLAHLVAYAGQMVPAAALITSLWGEEPPRSAAKSVQTFVLRLRNALEPDRNSAPSLLVTDGPGYRLAIAPADVDAAQFDRLVQLGRRALEDGRAEAAATTFADALSLWRGPAYAGFESTDFGRAESRRLEELRLSANEDRWAAELEQGRTAVVIPQVERLISEHPLRERMWALLMLALYRSGRQGEALGAFNRARETLAEGLGIDPGPELREMHARVLAQDPALVRRRRVATLPAQLVAPDAPLVGRDELLNRLLDAWRRASDGAAVSVALRGPSGAGATRLAGALADEVARAGAEVVFVDRDTPLPEVHSGGDPALVVVDHADAPPPPVRTMVLLLAGANATLPSNVEIIDLPPLTPSAVRELVSQYVDDARLEEAAAEVLRESGGWPGRVHEAAIWISRRSAVERVGAAAARANISSAALDAARADLSEGVAILNETAVSTAVVDSHVCPWRGLEAYDVEAAPWFAGRERLTAELVSRLAGTRLLGVVGASGSGKSSVVKAGLLASLKGDALPGSAAWTQIVMRPGQHPMAELARRALGSRQQEVGELLGQLIRVGETTAVERVVLVVDQFEEVWTACHDLGERAAFLDTLAELTYDPRSPVSAVFVVRADYVGELADHGALATRLTDATVLVGSPTPAEIRRAVERPAGRGGLLLDDGLADALVSDAGAEPGLLPLLSSALTQLWERRVNRRLTFAAYVGMGGLSGAIAHLAEDAYSALSSDSQAAARLLLLRLAGPGEGAVVARRRVPMTELEGLSHAGVRPVVDALAEARLLTVSDGHVEVAHESLFREWPRLHTWLLEDAAGRAVQRRLAVAASEWDAEGREATQLWRGTRLASGLEVAEARPDEITRTERAFLDAGREAVDADRREAEQRAATAARQNRRLGRLLAGLVLVLVAALVAGSLSVRARAQAEDARIEANAKRLAAAALNEELPDLAMLAAIEAVRSERSPETYGALLTLLSRSPDVVTRVRTPNRFLNVGATTDGSLVFLGENLPYLRALDSATGDQLWRIETPNGGQPGDPLASPDGSRVLVVATRPVTGWPAIGENPAAFLLDATTGATIWKLGGKEIREAAGPEASPWLGPDALWLSGNRILLTTDSHFLLVDAVTGRIAKSVAPPKPTPWHDTLRLLDDGRVSFVSSPGEGSVFDPRHPRRGIERLPGVIHAVSPDGKRVVLVTAAPEQSSFRIHDAKTLEPVSPGHPVDGYIHAAEWSPDGTTLVVNTDETPQVRDGRTGGLVKELAGHSGSAMDVAFAGPQGDLIWTAGRDGTAIAFDLSGSQGVFRSHPIEVAPHVGAGAEQADVAVISPWYEDRTNPAHLIHVDTGEDLFGELSLPPSCEMCQVASVAMSPDGALAVGGIEEVDPKTFEGIPDHGWLAVWSTRDGRPERAIPTPWPVYGVAVAPDSRHAVVNGKFGYAVVDLKAHRIVAESGGLDKFTWIDGLPTVEISPDGATAAVSRDKVMLIVDLTTGETLRRRDLDDTILSYAWSADSQTLVAGGMSGRVRFLDPSTLEEKAPTRLVAGGFVLDLQTSPNGDILASLGSDGDLMLWDTETLRPLGKPVADLHGWGWLYFTSDGKSLRVFYEDSSMVEIDIEREAWLQEGCRVANRDLTADESAVIRPGHPLRSTCAGIA